MKRCLKLFAAVAGTLIVGVPAVAQDFLISVDGDCGRQEAAPGTAYDAMWDVNITTSNNPETMGAQGWSISMAVEGAISILSVTYDGTVSAPVAEGGKQKGGFTVFEPDPLFDPPAPDVNCPGGLSGAVSAVILAQRLPITLEPNGTETVGKLHVQGSYPSAVGACNEGRIFFVNDCVGSGQPVQNIVTFNNTSRDATFRECAVQLCTAEGPPPDCTTQKTFIVVGLQSDTIAAPMHDQAGDLFVNFTDTKVVQVPEGTTGSTTAHIGFASQLASGVQGWSLSARITGDIILRDADPVTFEGGATTAGTAAAPQPDGKQKGGFEVTEKVDPTDIHPDTGMPQGQGVVQAIIIAQRLPITLEPVGTATVLALPLDAAGPQGSAPQEGRIEWFNNMTGSGQPVQNLATVNNTSVDFCECRAGTIRFVPATTGEGAAFIRCDPNNDGRSDIADSIWIINENFRAGPATACQNAADCNGSGKVEPIPDALYGIMYQFQGGSAPPAPYPACGRSEQATPESCPAGSTRC